MHTDKTVFRPVQTKSLSFKTGSGKESEDWRKANVNYYAGINSTEASYKKDFDNLYKLAEGYISKEHYSYVTSPLTSDKQRPTGYPSKLRNYDIITPIVELLRGEKIKRRIKPIVYAVNSDMTSVKEQQERKIIKDQLTQLVVNGINDLGLETGFESRDLKTHEQILNDVDSIKDDKAIMGQQSLNYILEYNEIERQQRKSWFDFVAVGCCNSYKDVFHNDVHYQSIDPRNVSYVCSQNIDFIEDGEAASIIMYLTPSEVIDTFHDELSKKQLERVQSFYNDGISNNSNYFDTDGSSVNNKDDENSKNINSFNMTVDYVNWKSLLKIGKVTGQDSFGEPYEFEVEEGFKPRPDEEVEWFTVNQVWEGFRLNLDGDIDYEYLRVRPVPHQRGTLDNPSKCKLLINGRNLFSRNYKSKSIVQKLEPYQMLHNVIHWHLEKTINKNKDKIVTMPYDFVPKSKNLDMQDMLYFADTTGIMFLSELSPQQLNSINNAIKVLDLSLSNYIQYLQNMLQYIKGEAEEMLGITRQRKGNVHSSDGKATTEQAIFQSSVMTEEYFRQFEEWQEKEYQGLLDLSKFAWLEGKKTAYVNSDKKTVYMNVQGQQHQEAEYGIFVGNTSEEKEKKDIIKSNVQSFIQNGMSPDVVIKLLTSDNLEEMNDLLEIHMMKMEQQQQAAQQAQMESEQAAKAFEEKKHDDEIGLGYAKLESEQSVSYLELEMKFRESAASANATTEDASKYIAEANKLQIAREKLQIDREKIASNERIAKDNNQTKLKNPVSGESK